MFLYSSFTLPLKETRFHIVCVSFIHKHHVPPPKRSIASLLYGFFVKKFCCAIKCLLLRSKPVCLNVKKKRLECKPIRYNWSGAAIKTSTR